MVQLLYDRTMVDYGYQIIELLLYNGQTFVNYGRNLFQLWSNYGCRTTNRAAWAAGNKSGYKLYFGARVSDAMANTSLTCQ